MAKFRGISAQAYPGSAFDIAMLAKADAFGRPLTWEEVDELFDGLAGNYHLDIV